MLLAESKYENVPEHQMNAAENMINERSSSSTAIAQKSTADKLLGGGSSKRPREISRGERGSERVWDSRRM